MPFIEIVGWFGSLVLVISLLQTRVLRLRMINLVGSLILLAYNAAIMVWPMVGLNTVLALINIYFLYKMLSTRHDAKAYSVIEVGSRDAYFEHVLSVHGDDIAETNPDFRHDAAADRLSFLVVHGDETVGVVVAADAGGGTAQVLLDWVTPRYRDLTPGEFVYRTSEVFTSRGFTRVLSPTNVQKPYYDQVGFTKDGDRWALNLAAPARN
ncbi:hypothetical protein K0651_06625 [Ornithinimicrobium sp. Arc0846-15]|nr:hypothetical protein [Ornithinimicrobium laminariae]